MKNKNYIMRGNYWLDAILMARCIQKNVDIVIGIENDEDHHEVAG